MNPFDWPFKDMDWDKLRIFLAVAQAGSFSRAVEILNITQSAISRQIAVLEATLRTPLFVRHSRGLILTEPGQLLFETVSQVFEKLEKTKQQMYQDTREARGSLKVATTFALGSFWVARFLPDFIREYPDINLSILITDQEADLSKREADVSIRPSMPNQPDLIQRHLTALRLRLYASPYYLEKMGTPKTAQDLDRHHLICYGDETHAPYPNVNWLLRVGAKSGQVRRPYLCVNSTLGMRLAAESDIGIVSLSEEYEYEPNPKLVPLLPHVEGPQLSVYYVYPERLRGSRKIVAFGDFLAKKIAEDKRIFSAQSARAVASATAVP